MAMRKKAKQITALLLSFGLLTGCKGVFQKEWDKQGVFYEIFLYSFYDSDGDQVGDFKGLTQKLDYLNDGNKETTDDLGVTGIWLMPIMTSPSVHKYDIVDYYNVDKQYGTIEDFKKFTEEAHKRGIKVIMDMVINHSSASHPWFKEAKVDLESPYRDYYIFTNDKEAIKEKGPIGGPQWHVAGKGYHYNAIFWNQMPDFNYDNPKVREEMKNIGKFWLELGVDGFRLDAAKHIYDGEGNHEKNIAWWKEYKEYLQKIKKDVYLVGEVWDSPEVTSSYYQSLDTNFNFSLGGEEGMITKAIKTQNGSNFAQEMDSIYEKYKETNSDFIDGPFLSNHDQNRIMSAFDENIEQGKMAANIYFTLRGNPFIYYGEEIGMIGRGQDDFKREPLKWFSEPKEGQTKGPGGLVHSAKIPSVEEQLKDPNSVLRHYQNLISIRQSEDALMYGDFEPIAIEDPSIIVFKRFTEKEELIVMHNVSKENKKVKLDPEMTKGKAIKHPVSIVQQESSISESGEVTIPAYTTIFIGK